MSKTLDELMGLIDDYADDYRIKHVYVDKSGTQESKAKMLARLAAIVEDAERYQHLKQSHDLCSQAWIEIGISDADSEKWDDIIDADRSQSKDQS